MLLIGFILKWQMVVVNCGLRINNNWFNSCGHFAAVVNVISGQFGCSCGCKCHFLTTSNVHVLSKIKGS